MAAGKKRPSGWYRYTLLYGGMGTTGAKYEFEIVLQKKNALGKAEDCSRETAENVLRAIGKYMAEKAQFENLKEDF